MRTNDKRTYKRIYFIAAYIIAWIYEIVDLIDILLQAQSFIQAVKDCWRTHSQFGAYRMEILKGITSPTKFWQDYDNE
ncbi:MAG: hypothetical protein ACTSSA_12060 [Candidatus Freyarchaeota archaeon]